MKHRTIRDVYRMVGFKQDISIFIVAIDVSHTGRLINPRAVARPQVVEFEPRKVDPSTSFVATHSVAATRRL